MKIFHLSSEKKWRGGEQQVAYLMEELHHLGIQNIIACRPHSALESYCNKQGWHFFSLPFKGSLDLSTVKAIKEITQKEQVDLIHIHSAQAQNLALLAYLSGNKVPLVLSRRVAFPIRKNIFTQWKYNHKALKNIICVSNAVERIVSTSVKHPHRCVTVHSGIDMNRYVKTSGVLRKTYKIPEDTLLIGNIAALDASKDLFTFIKVAHHFQQYQVPAVFFIIGDGPQKESLRQYITQHHLQSSVIMTGYQQNIAEILPELDIFLMTSETEGLGSSILDAFACKVPVIATRTGGIPEMVMHKQTGLLAEVKDAEKLAQHLKQLIDNPDLKRELVTNAYQHLLSNFTKEKMAARTLEIYQEVLQNKKPGL